MEFSCAPVVSWLYPFNHGVKLCQRQSPMRLPSALSASAGAILEPTQNPVSPQFTKPKEGYGARFAAVEAPRGTRMRYIVLGSDSKLGISRGAERLGIKIQERSWEDLTIAVKGG